MKIIQTETFENWYNKLKDYVVISTIRKRLDKIESSGIFGDHRKIEGSKGIWELRIHLGKGYRIYYTIRTNEIVLLLNGGVKDSQKRDAQRAAELLKNL